MLAAGTDDEWGLRGAALLERSAAELEAREELLRAAITNLHIRAFYNAAFRE
jgi:hypothetical protein